MPLRSRPHRQHHLLHHRRRPRRHHARLPARPLRRPRHRARKAHRLLPRLPRRHHPSLHPPTPPRTRPARPLPPASPRRGHRPLRHHRRPRFHMSDFSHLPTVAKYVALMPQWDFLNFLATEASAFPTFTLRMGWEATGLLRANDLPTASPASAPTPPTAPSKSPPRSPSAATAATPLRAKPPTSTSSSRASPSTSSGSPSPASPTIPRTPSATSTTAAPSSSSIATTTSSAASSSPKALPRHPAAGPRSLPPQLSNSLPRSSPAAPPRLDSWDKIKLLTVQINHLERWWLPGLLCIGDAAHAMSPVGGIGINIALQDAVAAANILAEPLRTHTLTDHHLQWVQQHRIQAVRRTQRVQVVAHRIANKALHHEGPMKPPLPCASSPASRLPATHRPLHRPRPPTRAPPPHPNSTQPVSHSEHRYFPPRKDGVKVIPISSPSGVRKRLTV